jgi:multisubunit Na+/H+ antiporter MnhC subunit
MKLTTAISIVIGLLVAAGVFLLTAPTAGVAFAAGQAVAQGGVTAALLIVGARIVSRALSDEKQTEQGS